MVGLTGGAGLLGQVEGRTAAIVPAWIDAQSAAWRTGVRVVAIDMCAVFKAAVCDSMPHATLVVDRFHVAQLANAALTEVRRRVTVRHRGRRGRKGNRQWELRNRLTRSAARMHADHLDPMAADFMAVPKPIGKPILAAWNVTQILAAITAGVTNAAPEGINRAIKTDARCAYGYRNPANQRLRATARRARGHHTTHTSGRHAQPRNSRR